MGSKAAMLSGPLGSLLETEAARSARFVDLFAGSAAVSHHVATRVRVPVVSVDLQQYSSALALSITGRVQPLVGTGRLRRWLAEVRLAAPSPPVVASALTEGDVAHQRDIASRARPRDFVTRQYGGHYFSVVQAATLDLMLQKMPPREPHRSLCLAAVIATASRVAAAPGHTAQPFQPTSSLLPFIQEAWKRDVLAVCEEVLDSLGRRHALTRGSALRMPASSVIPRLNEHDLVFCDPPYSAAQYSRFYHVLEGIARGGWAEVGGAGRAPDRATRASSSFSLRTQAPAAMREMLGALAARRARCIVTFPDADASNGLSAALIEELAAPDFDVEVSYVQSSHSTLGGAGGSERGARREVKEAVLFLTPSRKSRAVPPTRV